MELTKDNIAYFLLGIIFLILIAGKFGAKIKYISVKGIVRNYFGCFKYRGKYLIIPILNYFVAPFLLGVSAALFRVITNPITNIVTIIVSILTSMLFTLLTMIADMKGYLSDNDKYSNTEFEVSKGALIETYHIVMFEILISVLLLVLCLFNAYTKKFVFVLSCMVYSLSFLLVINLLMILKRFFYILNLYLEK